MSIQKEIFANYFYNLFIVILISDLHNIFYIDNKTSAKKLSNAYYAIKKLFWSDLFD